MGQAFSDIKFLSCSEHRVAVLVALAERSRSRSDLQTLTGASPSTIGRLLSAFETRNWVTRERHRYKATQLGTFVATGITELIERMETERELRDVWEWLPPDVSGLPIEVISAGVVTVADADEPYRPATRFVSLLRETDRFRFVGTDIALIGPCIDEVARLIVDGMRTEVVHPANASRAIRSIYPEQDAEALESDYFTHWWHDDLPPYGVCLFDDRVAITGYDAGSGAVRVLIDTDAREAREWAESVYESYRREARPATSETTAG